MTRNLKVFCSHRSVDKPQVRAIAERLAAAGIDPWVDAWEINPGDDIVAKINEGLDSCDVGLIFFSKKTLESSWVQNEVSNLTYQAIEDGKPIIPVMIDRDAPIPQLLRHRARLASADIEGLIDAIYNRSGRSQKPRVAPSREARRERRFQITLHETEPDHLQVSTELDDQPIGEEQNIRLDTDFHFSYQGFLRSTLPGISRSRPEDVTTQRERDLIRLGQAMGKAIFPGLIGEKLAAVLDETRASGEGLLLRFETPEPKLLAMPFEAARLPDGRAPALEPGVRVLRRHPDARVDPVVPLAGPLRILVVVGVPDEGQTANVVLDQEHELQTILNAIDQAREYGNAEVKILEVGHPQEIQRALLAQSYHVLHLSGHGHAGVIEMEDEDGRAVAMTAEDLVDAIRRSGKRIPLIFLASCLSGADDNDTTGFTQGLLKSGIPLVLAMQSSVSDWYATRGAATETAGASRPASRAFGTG